MKIIKNIFDKIDPHFQKGGKLEKISSIRHYDFKDLRRNPEDTKKYFKGFSITIVNISWVTFLIINNSILKNHKI